MAGSLAMPAGSYEFARGLRGYAAGEADQLAVPEAKFSMAAYLTYKAFQIADPGVAVEVVPATDTLAYVAFDAPSLTRAEMLEIEMDIVFGHPAQITEIK